MDLRLIPLLACLAACRAMNPTTGGAIVDTTKPATITSPGPTSFTLQTIGSPNTMNQQTAAFVPPIAGASEAYPIQETGQSSGFPIQTAGQGNGYPGQTTGQSSGYQVQTTGQNSIYPGPITGQNSIYNGQTTSQNTGYQGQTTGQNTGYQGQTTGQNTGYQGQTAGQNTGYQGQTPGQNNGYQYQNTAFQGQATNNQAWYSGAPNNQKFMQASSWSQPSNNLGMMQVSNSPVPNNQQYGLSGQNQQTNGMGQNLAVPTSGNAGSAFQSYLNSMSNPATKPSFGFPTGGNGMNANLAASSLTNTIGGQGNQGMFANNPQALNSLAQKFFNNVGLAVSMGGMDAVEGSNKMMASASLDFTQRLMHQYPSYGLLQSVRSDPQSYNAARNYLIRMAQADRSSDMAARLALSQALANPNPLVQLMAQIDTAAGKFGVSDVISRAARMKLYSTYKSPGVFSLRS